MELLNGKVEIRTVTIRFQPTNLTQSKYLAEAVGAMQYDLIVQIVINAVQSELTNNSVLKKRLKNTLRRWWKYLDR